MPAITDITTQNLNQFGIKGFGFTMPVSTTKWCDASAAAITGIIDFTEDELALNITGSNTWLAPLSSTAVYVNTSDNKISATLIRADGSIVNEQGWFCTLFPQQFLRLKRLVAKNFEVDNAHNPLKSQGISIRQIPKYYFIAKDSLTPTVHNGMIFAGDDFQCGGKLQFFDESGYIIHPLMVCNILKELMTKYSELNTDSALVDQLSNIVSLVSTDSVTVRFINADGSPNDGSHLQGVSPKNAGIGLFTVNASSDTTLLGEISREADTGSTGAFPLVNANRLLFSLVTYGRLGNKVSLAKTDAITLHQDFFTVRVVEMQSYLLGEPDSTFNGTKLEPKPAVRLNEQLGLLTDGNDIMAAISLAFTGTVSDSYLVGTQLNTAFPLPADATHAHWPDFPVMPGALTPDDIAFLPTLKDEIKKASKAEFITGTLPQPYDVKLTLVGIPKGATARVYNRVFGNDAVISRGDGAGGVAVDEAAADPNNPRAFNGQAIINLPNPLGILRPDHTTTVPQNPKLIFDLVIIERSGKRKILGALELPVQAAVAAPAAPPANAADAASHKGVSNSAILGYDTHNLTSITAISSLEDAANFALKLFGEAPPRDAPRLPTMARRDLLVATRKTTNWESVISGGAFIPGIHSADPKQGCPGSLGGKETTYTGVAAKNACLAYDIARMAFRRTDYFVNRLIALADDVWNEPVANTPLGETETSTDTKGSFFGAVLQNIAPYCETPELALLKTVVESNISSIPADFNALVDQVVNWINGISTTGLPSPLDTAAGALKTAVVGQLNGLKDNNPAHESRNERLYNELKRELSSACYGRRDSQWALKKAIQRARQFIYIETPGISFTQDTAQNYTADLLGLISAQISGNPGLKVIICSPKQPDYHPSYDQWIQSEIKKRYELLMAIEPKQLVCFHPIGFPGRPSNIESHTVIIDDCWALLGSSAFRRRGLAFDGSSDIVFTDGEWLNGLSPSIKNFRTSLLKKRLGFENLDAFDSKQNMLKDGRQSFFLIRELLVAGGIGKIERLWNGHTDGVEYHDPTIDFKLANPEGLEFNSLAAIVNAAFAGLAK
jgi:hypothetical protein